MDKLRSFKSFIAAVQTGSLSAAARQQEITQPAISQQISALETSYATQLLHRTRNGVKPTEAGDLFFRRAKAIVREHQELEEDLLHLSDGVAGQLKVSTSLGFSQFIMLDVLKDLRIDYPELKIIIAPEDRVIDLVTEQFDLAVRAGTLGEENAIGRRIGELSAVHVAAPAYLDEHGRPEEPDQLQQLNYIQYRADDDVIATPLQNGQELLQAPIKSNLTAQLPDLVFQALYSNMGYAKAPYFMVSDAVERGELEIVLPGWQPPSKDLFLVYPHRHAQTQRMRVFLKALIKQLLVTPGISVLSSVKREFSSA